MFVPVNCSMNTGTKESHSGKHTEKNSLFYKPESLCEIFVKHYFTKVYKIVILVVEQPFYTSYTKSSIYKPL